MPVHYPQCAGKPYRPSNGTEGEMFQEQFCHRCRRDQDEDDPCTILTETMAFSIDDAEYPTEWVYDKDGTPCCTAFTTDPKKPVRCDKTLDLFALSSTHQAAPHDGMAPWPRTKGRQGRRK